MVLERAIRDLRSSLMFHDDPLRQIKGRLVLTGLAARSSPSLASAPRADVTRESLALAALAAVDPAPKPLDVLRRPLAVAGH
jgi:hypothetical protein